MIPQHIDLSILNNQHFAATFSFALFRVKLLFEKLNFVYNGYLVYLFLHVLQQCDKFLASLATVPAAPVSVVFTNRRSCHDAMQ